MTTTISKKERIRLEYYRGISYGALLVIFLLVVDLIILFAVDKQIHERRSIKEFHELEKIEWVIELELQQVHSDLCYFSESAVARSFLEHRDSLSESHLESFMKQIVATQNKYTHISILDTSSQELICITNSENGPVTCIDPLIHSEKCKYPNAITSLAAGELYTEQLQFTHQAGTTNEELENIIQISTPIFSTSGTRIGIGVVNYLGESIDDIIENIEVDDKDLPFLITRDGQYLKKPGATNRKTVKELQASRSFSVDYPDIWGSLTNCSTGFLTSDMGEFYYSSLNLAPQMSITRNEAILLLHVPAEQVRSDSRSLYYGLLLGSLLLAPLLFIMGMKQGKYQVHQQWLFQRLEEEATHDSLTGLLNRRAILEQLKMSFTLAKRRNSDLSVGFIDLNNLKQLNDTLGHEAGDELLRGCARSMKMVIRSSDSGARMGGDEFMIVFPDCDRTSAENIMKRIELQFASIGLEQSGSTWSMSYGCASLQGETDAAELIVERADSNMYVHKQSQKRNGEVSY